MIEYVINTDGGARGNPGPAGTGFVVVTPAGETKAAVGAAIGEATNNEAEYQAFISSAEWILAQTEVPNRVQWRLDSMLVVEQLNKKWKIKEPRLRVMAEKAWQLLAQLPSSTLVSITHVRRADNAIADALVNKALDEAS